MEIYKNKITKEFYIRVSDLDAITKEAKFLNIKDKYTYTIPIEDMDFWLDERVVAV